MATQVHLPAAVPFRKSPAGIINVPSSFKIRAQDGRLESAPDLPATTTPEPLGVLSNFVGTFAGSGFNLIFRPNSGPPHGTTFTNPVSPLPPIAPSENVLELNLTSETLAFSNNLGSIPNRGLGGQSDIFLNGVPYVQSISDVSNPKTGKGDANPSPIHFEPGLWMHVPATSTDPVLGESLVRMASIPHGTTINAQCLAPTTSIAGPPTIQLLTSGPFRLACQMARFILSARTLPRRTPLDCLRT